MEEAVKDSVCEVSIPVKEKETLLARSLARRLEMGTNHQFVRFVLVSLLAKQAFGAS